MILNAGATSIAASLLSLTAVRIFLSTDVRTIFAAGTNILSVSSISALLMLIEPAAASLTVIVAGASSVASANV